METSKVYELTEEVRQLKQLLSGSGEHNFRDHLNLTPKMSTMLGVLVANKIATRDMFMSALYSDRADPPFDCVIGTMLCQLRQRIKKHGYTIQTHGHGAWSLSEIDRAKLKAVPAPWRSLDDLQRRKNYVRNRT